jgi:hypothetical protein
VTSERPAVGAFAYFESDPANHADVAHAALKAIVGGADRQDLVIQMSLYKAPSTQGRLRAFKWKAVEEAILDPDVKVLDFVVGASSELTFAAKLQLRSDSNPQRAPSTPRRFTFACEAAGAGTACLIDAAREMLEGIARSANPISGGAIAAPTFHQAYCEIEDGGDREREPMAFQERIRIDRRFDSDRWTKARRLYPITLLGPKLASQVTAAEARAAGALAVKEINGSLLIDAYPTVVETWDPEFLKATVELRRWLWPHTIQNPADAVGLGLKLPKR